jgi:hypothetical protein
MFLLEGELPLLDFLEIMFWHIYHHCKTIGILCTPDSLVTWYKAGLRVGHEGTGPVQANLLGL